MRTFAVCFVALIAAASLAAPPAGVVTTVAGQPGVAGYWDGPASDALFTHPTWLDVVPTTDPRSCDEGRTGEIFVVDRINQLVRRISDTGSVSTFTVMYGLARPVPLDFDSAFGGGVLVEPPGAGCGCSVYSRGVFLASSGTNQVVLAHPSGFLAARDDWSPINGTGAAGARDGDSSSEAQFNKPTGMAFAFNGDRGLSLVNRAVYVADSGNHTIRRINWQLSFEACPQGKRVTTLAGAAGQPGSADGVGSAARFNTPRGIVVAPDGTLYVTDAGNHTVRRITPDGSVTTVAGVPGVPGSDDGPALQAHLNTPSGIDVNDKGEVFIVDTFSHTVRMLKDGMLTTIAGTPGVSGFADGDAATAKFNAPVGLKIAPDGSIVVADTGNNVIRRIRLNR